MNLTKYLDANKIDRRAFAAEIGVDPITVYRWEKGQRIPHRDFLPKIREATRNKVTANDFFEAGAQ